MASDRIVVRGAREHNLKNIDLEIPRDQRSEEHTSELQSQSNLVCRLLLEKKKPKHAQRATRPGVARSPKQSESTKCPCSGTLYIRAPSQDGTALCTTASR